MTTTKRLLVLLLCTLGCIFSAAALEVSDYSLFEATDVQMSLLPVSTSLAPDETIQVTVQLDAAPQGLSGYNLSVQLTDPAVAEIVDVRFPAWSSLPINSTVPADEVWCKAVDLTGTSGTAEITLVTVTVRADAVGTTNVTVLPTRIEDRQGGRYTPAVAQAQLQVGASAQPPVANFTANITSGTVPLTVQFTDTSTGSPNAWNWTFGDGATSAEQNPVHTYDTAGTFTVSLTARNADGEDTRTQTGYITVMEIPTGITHIDALPATSSQNVGQTQTYTVMLDAAPAGLSGYNLSVQLTDPAVAEIVDVRFPAWSSLPINSTVPADEVWCKAVDLTGTSGTAEITLVTVTVRADAVGTTNVTVLPTRIEDRQGGRYTPAVAQAQLQVGASAQPPVANFTANITAGVAPLAVRFTDTSTGDPTAWSWTFGDGATATEQHPVHTYTLPGNYTVNLTVENSFGANYTVRSDYIIVGELPLADFDADPASGIAPLTVQFTDRSSGVISTWNWTFGDGSTSTEQHPTHEYASAGDYTVSLRIANAWGENTTVKIDYVHVGALPVANFTANVTAGPAPLAVRFTDTSSNNPTFWSWSFGDGATSTEQNPVHTYTAAGTYTVNLTVSTGSGSDTLSRPGYVTVTVRGDFNGNGAVDVGDVSKVAYMVVGKAAADLAADFNRNSAVDIGDAAKIAYYFVGKIPAL